MANQYHQIPADVVADGNDSQPVTTRRWLKVGAALSVSGLVLLGIVIASSSTSILHSTTAVESTSLLGLSRSLRSPVGGAVKNGIAKAMNQNGMYSQGLDMYSFASSPIAKLAVLGIQANHLDNMGVRDLSLKAQMDTVMASMDQESKEEVAKVADAMTLAQKEQFPGVSGPFGYWDPWGLAADVPEGRLLFLREAELKHGRVCMLAVLGILVGEKYHPLFGGDIDVPAYALLQQTYWFGEKIQSTQLQTFWIAVFAAIGWLEFPQLTKTFNWLDPVEKWSLPPGSVPGNYDWDPLGLKPSDPGSFKAIQTKEINNGRLAMIGVAGMLAQEIVDGKKIFG